jgi:hypothetical protein
MAATTTESRQFVPFVFIGLLCPTGQHRRVLPARHAIIFFKGHLADSGG